MQNKEINEGSIWEGIFVSALNPKVAIFFLAFLPQFIQAGTKSPTQQLIFLGLIFSFTSTLVNMGAGLATCHFKNRNHSIKNRRFSLDKICGVVMVGMAVKLTFTR